MENISNELRARIFAAHLGASIVIPSIADDDDWEDYFLQQVDKWGGVTIGHPEHGISTFQPNDGVKLVLSPLSSITDEHAIEVAKILDYPLSEINDSQVLTDTVSEHLEDIISGNCATYSDYVSGATFQILIDYLRSKEYDCGYGSIPSLIESGIAIEKK